MTGVSDAGRVQCEGDKTTCQRTHYVYMECKWHEAQLDPPDQDKQR
jgi:hypothetical protein